MKYEQCLKYLEKIQSLGIKFGLDNVKTILSSFENPYQKYPSILVAGTNGKGSVCAMLTHILTLHGFQTGLFTSPHLVKPEERIRIGNRLISSRSFCRGSGRQVQKSTIGMDPGPRGEAEYTYDSRRASG